MRYIGSKVATVPVIARMVRLKAPDARSLCDAFAGTCVVARHFKQLGFQVVTGDLLQLSYVFQLATILRNRVPRFTKLRKAGIVAPQAGEKALLAVLRHLDGLSGRPGYITRHYSPAGRARRRFFTVDNAERIDRIRGTIATWRRRGLISKSEEAYLVACLLDAADKVANTAGTYFAHLKQFSRKALKRMTLAPLEIADNGEQNRCYVMDARELAASSDADVLYLDPPYNGRDYAGYYHLPETIARWDRPKPRGRSGVPAPGRVKRSDFCRPQQAAQALETLIGMARAKHVVVHYTTDGLIPHRRIVEILSRRGPTTFRDLPVRAYSTRAEQRPVARHRLYWCDLNR
jgi:adenine-specific DNA-methyltransferase